jgi:hypothetical protein
VNGNMATASCFDNNSPCEIGVACTTVGSKTGACVPASCDNLSEEGGCPSPCDLSPSFCDEIGSFPSLSAPALLRRE